VSTPTQSHAVYPRWRGELKIAPSGPYSTNGLSPLARGTLLCYRYHRAAARFIPAGAGNSAIRGGTCAGKSVYPRWRGELLWFPRAFTISGGLSPLARGTLFQLMPGTAKGRFIPAGAGNSCHNPIHRWIRAVYPRWRGELERTSLGMLTAMGLSPLARGTRVVQKPSPATCRFIPAGAGNSQYHYLIQPKLPVYPRWRGELIKDAFDAVISPGLSPLARGTPYHTRHTFACWRFIPAGAGNSSRIRISRRSRAVYPRWRGELPRA